ncbi:MAG: vWA domain-containing protein [Bryobacteraceae bacterium]
MRRIQNPQFRRKGFAIILTALMLTIIIPMVGLAIDAGMLFAIRARTQSAADAAAMASARALSVGLTIQDQLNSATARAQTYFDANFPSKAMMTGTTRTVSILVEEVPVRTRRVSVTIDVTAPSFFMRYLPGGAAPLTHVRVMGQTSRRDVNVMLVVDRSGSLQNSGSCDDLESASIQFTQQFANQRDKLGLITFGGNYRVDYAMTRNWNDAPTIATELGKLYPGGCLGWTGTPQALWNGYQQLLAQNEPGVLNVILLFTDGNPNTITAEWPLKLSSTTETANKTHCYDWGHTKDYTQLGWNPSGQKYFGYIARDINSWDGIRPTNAAAMGAVVDPGTAVAIPVGYTGSAKSTDCWYRSSSSNVKYDVPYQPDTDYYGNSLYGYKSTLTYPVGHPYAGKIKIWDDTTANNSAFNATADAATRIRANASNLAVVIYTLGLGGVGAAENELLLRVANDKTSPIFDSSKPEGLYVYAPDASQLSSAFARIAAEILRYNK